MNYKHVVPDIRRKTYEEVLEEQRQRKYPPLPPGHFYTFGNVDDSHLGVVYFFYARELNQIKIGFSMDVEKRLVQVQVSCPARVEDYHTIPGTLETERQLHELFSKFRKTGEWFEASPELIEFIESSKRALYNASCAEYERELQREGVK